jgi:hypothetical protein
MDWVFWHLRQVVCAMIITNLVYPFLQVVTPHAFCGGVCNLHKYFCHSTSNLINLLAGTELQHRCNSSIKPGSVPTFCVTIFFVSICNLVGSRCTFLVSRKPRWKWTSSRAYASLLHLGCNLYSHYPRHKLDDYTLVASWLQRQLHPGCNWCSYWLHSGRNW